MFPLPAASSLFAQEAEPAPAPNQNPNAGPVNPLMQMAVYFVPLALVFYFLMLRPNQKKERDRKSMLTQIKKNDHVITVGGIKGVVANVKLEEGEVVLRVDETTGAKLHVVLDSIARVVASQENADATKKDS